MSNSRSRADLELGDAARIANTFRVGPDPSDELPQPRLAQPLATGRVGAEQQLTMTTAGLTDVDP